MYIVLVEVLDSGDRPTLCVIGPFKPPCVFSLEEQRLLALAYYWLIPPQIHMEILALTRPCLFTRCVYQLDDPHLRDSKEARWDFTDCIGIIDQPWDRRVSITLLPTALRLVLRTNHTHEAEKSTALLSPLRS